MKFILISDTHNCHGALQLPEDADGIIHAGDLSMRGKKDEIEDFLAWYSSLPYKYKIFIAGNHDFFFENRTRELINEVIPANITYLEDEEIIIEGIKTNIPMHQALLRDTSFIKGGTDIHYLEKKLNT